MNYKLLTFFVEAQENCAEKESAYQLIKRRLRGCSSNEHLALRDAALAFAAECERGIDYDGEGGPSEFIETLKENYP